MAPKRIVWTNDARSDFKATLEFYNLRNGSIHCSRKLSSEIFALIRMLPKNNYLGLPVADSEIRVLVKGTFNIFYELKEQEIVILMVWDTRRNPDELPKFVS